MVYRLSMFLYGSVCLYNKCTLIKVALEVSSDSIIFLTNYATYVQKSVLFLIEENIYQLHTNQ